MAFTHVLITRPQPEADQLAASFAGSPLEPVVIPAYAFSPALASAGLDVFRAGAGRRLAVFTSKRSVEFGLRQLPAGFLEGVEIAAIGPATAAALERSGQRVSVVPQGEFTSESLLAHPALAGSPGRAVIFTAPGGRQALEEGLGRLGWEVHVVHVYRREDLAPGAAAVGRLLQAGGLISVWTSENAMQHLASALPAAAWQAVCRGAGVVTSGRLQEALEKLGVGTVRVAAGPGNDAIRECALQLT